MLVCLSLFLCFYDMTLRLSEANGGSPVSLIEWGRGRTVTILARIPTGFHCSSNQKRKRKKKQSKLAFVIKCDKMGLHQRHFFSRQCKWHVVENKRSFRRIIAGHSQPSGRDFATSDVYTMYENKMREHYTTHVIRYISCSLP